MDMQNLNALFSSLSTTAMIAFIALGLPWIQVASKEGGFDMVEE